MIIGSPSAVLTRRSLSSATQNQNWERSDQPNTQAEKVFSVKPERRRLDCRVDSLAGRCAPSSDFVQQILKAIRGSNEKRPMLVAGSQLTTTLQFKLESTKGTRAVKFKQTIVSIPLLALLFTPACQSTRPEDNLTGIVVVNSPATGRITRIVVAEGVHVEQGTPVVEISVQSETNAMTTPARDGSEAKAVSSYQSADAAIEAARAEVVRHEAEVTRLTPLVDSGAASQGELDGERALYEQAQRRLTQAQEAKRNAESALLAARQPNQSQVNVPTPHEQIVSAVSSSSGKVAVISVRVGELVKVGD